MVTRSRESDDGARYRHRMVSLPGFTVYRGVHAQGTELPRHSHDDPTLCYVLRGRFTEYSAGLAMDCLSGTLKITPGGENHWNRFAASETRGLRIDVDRSRFSDSPAIRALLDERLLLSGRQAGDVMHRLVAELDTHDDASAIAVEGLLLELLAALARENVPARAGVISPWLRDADELIHETYPLPIGLASIADAVGVAAATLARSYRTAFRVSVGERIRALRLERAVRDLISTREPLSSIALAAGYYDQSHFTNAFRRRYGVTPAEYRRRFIRS